MGREMIRVLPTGLDLRRAALAQVRAELNRREHMIADAGAKDIEDYLAAKEAGWVMADDSQVIQTYRR